MKGMFKNNDSQSFYVIFHGEYKSVIKFVQNEIWFAINGNNLLAFEFFKN